MTPAAGFVRLRSSQDVCHPVVDSVCRFVLIVFRVERINISAINSVGPSRQ